MHREVVKMAGLEIEGNELVMHLSKLEVTFAVHGDLRAPLSAIRAIEVLENAHEPADHGFKIGVRIRGVSEVATVRTGGEKLFAAVYHDTPRGDKSFSTEWTMMHGLSVATTQKQLWHSSNLQFRHASNA